MNGGAIIYIRHGADERTSHKYDERLTHEGKHDVKHFTLQLLEKNGYPEIIYYSPFYRTRQTRKIMKKVLSKYRREHNIPNKVIYISEPRLGRFFTKKQSKRPDIMETTLERGAIIYETKDEFYQRIEDHLNEIEESPYKNIWNITHSLIILRVAKLKNIERESRVQYLDTVEIVSE